MQTVSERSIVAAVGSLVHVKVIGKPDEGAYISLTAQVAEHIQRHSEVHLLLEADAIASRFDDCSSLAFWQYAVRDFRYRPSIKRVALIGDPRWALVLAVLCKPYTSAKIRHFGRDDVMEAKRWADEP